MYVNICSDRNFFYNNNLLTELYSVLPEGPHPELVSVLVILQYNYSRFVSIFYYV